MPTASIEMNGKLREKLIFPDPPSLGNHILLSSVRDKSAYWILAIDRDRSATSIFSPEAAESARTTRFLILFPHDGHANWARLRENRLKPER